MISYTMEGKLAKATAVVPVSLKASVEICSFIRSDSLDKAISKLDRIAAGIMPVPYRKYSVPHKTGIGPGRFPIKAASAMQKLLLEVKKNAAYTGLGDNLVISKLLANKPAKAMHSGRRRRRMKQARIEVVVREAEEEQAGAKK